ncbi:ferritin family protein [Myroides guanonis]|uniref:DUF4369 domain-containing protein n=1 Tax=Myroides guanonis TaxID=1150112 RepID=A0A1I3THT7_9FLAO|nr:hypothetical protein [Myroides guanonis]SFJ70455.1 hypothetical protein SAMN04487893_11390 [Myroides guanonis]
MRTFILYIAMCFCLCFVFKGQAQQNSKEKNFDIESFEGKTKEKLQFLVYGMSPKLLFDNSMNPIYIWNEDKEIESVEIIGAKQFKILLDSNFKADYKNVKSLVLRLNTGEKLELTEKDFILFDNLEFLVIQFDEEATLKQIIDKFQELQLSGKFKQVELLIERIYKMDSYEE